ncbi:uncharacterized protein LOC109863206 [Pseudomyrmex gracilis]|uniref:uncharacterized protein LOC109863206 n=1 Tax=Pseudomyrmex gracilis TaxID=219809 RepID=UPI000994977C|nr:uncharacterized protein LOC109863206 [Pseudomyrmex gracilis]
MFEAAVMGAIWGDPIAPETQPDEEAVWLNQAITDACDISMSRVRKVAARKSTYWWSPEIARLRSECLARRRRYTRARTRRNVEPEALEVLHVSLRKMQQTLRSAIITAKKVAWKELISTVDDDPWGTPYRVVMSCLRAAGPPATETMNVPEVLDVINSLFPVRKVNCAETRNEDLLTPDLEVNVSELNGAVRRMTRKRTAPGMDGIAGPVWNCVAAIAPNIILRCFNNCLYRGIFPVT